MISLSAISLKKIVPLILTLVLVSAIVYFTLASFGGLYTTAVELMAGGEDVLLIYSAGAKAPQTSIIPLSLYDKVAGIDGVEVVSPEAVAVALAGDHAIIVRGVDPTSFQEICGVRIVRGSFELSNSWSAVIGSNLARLLKVDVDDQVLIRSAFINDFLEVKIVGVFESDSQLDDELIVPLYVAQWLRGLPKDAISLLRIKIDEGKLSREDVIAHLRGERRVEEKPSAEMSPIIRLLTIPRAREYAREYVVKNPEESMRDFLEKNVRIHEATIWGIVAVVIAGSILLIYLAFSLTLMSHSRELVILRSLGASRRTLTISLMTLTLALSMLTVVAGFSMGGLLSSVFSESGLLLLGSYVCKPVFSLDAAVIAATVLVIISIVSVWLELRTILKEALWEV